LSEAAAFAGEAALLPGQQAVAIDDVGRDVDELRPAAGECTRGVAKATASSTEWRSRRMSFARSV
jgi:hypothetical protein